MPDDARCDSPGHVNLRMSFSRCDDEIRLRPDERRVEEPLARPSGSSVMLRLPTNGTPVTVVAPCLICWRMKPPFVLLSLTENVYRPAFSVVTDFPLKVRFGFPAELTVADERSPQRQRRRAGRRLHVRADEVGLRRPLSRRAARRRARDGARRARRGGA